MVYLHKTIVELYEKYNLSYDNLALVYCRDIETESNEDLVIPDDNKVYGMNYEELNALHIQFAQYLDKRISKLEKLILAKRRIISMEQQNNTTQEVVSYEKDKIQLLLNILNSMQFAGIQQAQGIAQISVILNNPIQLESEKDGKDNEVK